MAAILVVDDDSDSLQRLRATLESHGHAVLSASDPQAGVSMLREGGIDLVVYLRRDDAQAQALVDGLDKLPDPPPFVMVSGAASAPALSAHLGAAAFVPEPLA